MARPAIATERLHELPDGRIFCALHRPCSDGTTAIVFEPLTFLSSRRHLAQPGLERHPAVLIDLR